MGTVETTSSGAGLGCPHHAIPRWVQWVQARPGPRIAPGSPRSCEAATPDAKLAVLFGWVLAAGGWIDGMTALLPPLPHRLAKLELARMLRQFRIEIREVAAPGGEGPLT